MKNTHQSDRIAQSNRFNFYFLFRLIILILLVMGGVTSRTQAQSGNDTWSAPINLSASGGTSDPQIVVDSDGRFHVLWIDEFSDFGYTSGDGTEWDPPVQALGPYETFPPEIFADGDGFIHAFWSDDNSDFFTSQARTNDFATMNGWKGVSQLGSYIVDVDVALDSEGGMHLVYIRTEDSETQPAGVYYQNLDRLGTTWSLPALLYQSDYLRSATPETSGIDIVATTVENNVHLYVVWDNRPRERVYLTRSMDGGELWSSPEEIDKPVEGTIDSGALNIRISAEGNEVLLLWQTAKTDTSCQQYYQFSYDGGNTWGSRQRMFEGFQICPDDIQILRGESGPILLLTGVQTYLQAWDGSRWSDPQLQDSLMTFIDPETQNLVEFGCQQGVLQENVDLYVVGCDLGPGGDTWLRTRQLVDIPGWFPQEAVWSQLASVTNSEARLRSPSLTADGRGRLHAFWSQSDSADPNGQSKAIHYARWEAGQWSQPESILASPDGKTDQPAAIVSADNLLYIVWSGGIGGQIYFSQANADQAVLAESWENPRPLPALQPVGSMPSIVMSQDGVISVAYAIPLNENRGVYLVQSGDGGQSWNQPVQVFDAIAAGWAMVDLPSLAVTEDGHMHILWSRYSLPGGEGPLALYYARSEDGGVTWLSPQPVVEKGVGWSQIVGIGQNTVHRVWQEGSSGSTTLWHEQSLDGGLNWQRTAPVSVFGETAGLPSLAWDSSGQLQLFQVVKSGLNQYVMQHWRFDGTRWSAERSLDLDFTTDTSVLSDTADITENGDLGVLFSIVSGDLASETSQDQLLFSNRLLGESLAGTTPVIPPESTPTLAVEPTVVAMSTPTLVATQVMTLEPVPTITEAVVAMTNTPVPIVDDSEPTRNSWLTSLVGPLMAGLVILAIALVSFRLIRNRQR